MSDAEGRRSPLISPLLVAGLVLVSALSLVAYFALSAYAPDLRDESDGDAHVLSRSAIGFAGLKILLQETNVQAVVDRGLATNGAPLPSLKVLTPSILSPGSEIKALCNQGPCLVILPKWLPLGDPIKRGRVVKVGAFEAKAVARLLEAFSKDTKIEQSKDTRAPLLTSPLSWPIPNRLAAIDAVQTISGKYWLPALRTAEGKIVLAYSYTGGGRQVFVLADPDLMNTHGLNDEATAALALATIDRLRSGGGPVAFDVTLNGFRRSRDILRSMFAPPFLGATLCAIAAALLIGFHAFSRFGAAARPAPGFALGKTALVDNTAQLIRVMGREAQMAERYATATRNLVLRALGLQRRIEQRQIESVLGAIERRESDVKFAEISAEADRVRRRSDLMRVAAKLYRWRERIVHAR